MYYSPKYFPICTPGIRSIPRLFLIKYRPATTEKKINSGHTFTTENLKTFDSEILYAFDHFLMQFWQMMRSRSRVATWIVAVFFFLAGMAYMITFNWTMKVTNTEQFCIGCHEMKDNVYPTYTKSIHYSNRSGVRATCSDCHVPHEWTDKIVRKVQASKEVWGKITGIIDTPEKFAEHRLYLAKREWDRFVINSKKESRMAYSKTKNRNRLCCFNGWSFIIRINNPFICWNRIY